MKKEFQPTGKLGQLLDEWHAPASAKSSIGRRADLVVARGLLPVGDVENVILDSISMNGGPSASPDWTRASQNVGQRVNQIYRSTRRNF